MKTLGAISFVFVVTFAATSAKWRDARRNRRRNTWALRPEHIRRLSRLLDRMDGGPGRASR